jgi:hypothetical protein
MTDNSTNIQTAIIPIADKIGAFGDILRRIEASGIKTVPILKKIESNTSRLSKLYSKEGVQKTVTAQGAVTRKVVSKGHTERVQKAEKTIQSATIVEAKRVKTKQGKAKQIDSQSVEVASIESKRRASKRTPEVADMPIVEAKRDRTGRYVGKSKKQSPVAETETPTKQRGKLGTMAAFALTLAKDRSKGGKDTAIEAVGRALGGPIVDAIIDVKQHYDRARDTVKDVRDKYGKFKGEESPTGRKYDYGQSCNASNGFYGEGRNPCRRKRHV